MTSVMLRIKENCMTKKLKILAMAAGLAASLSLVVGVTTSCSSSRYHRSTGTYLDDKTISTKVKTELYADPNVKGTQVQVTTYQGAVQLSGFVDTQAEKDRAAEVARRVQGVQKVTNNLIVKNAPPSTVPSTAGLTNKIQEPAGTPQTPAPVTPPPQPPPEIQPAPTPAPPPPPQPQGQPVPAPAPGTESY